MYTADMARKRRTLSIDNLIEQAVKDAGGAEATESYIQVYWDPDCMHSMAFRTGQLAAALSMRGFEVTAIKDLESFRFAEVHFSWANP